MLGVLLPILAALIFMIGDVSLKAVPKSISSMTYILLRVSYLGILSMLTGFFYFRSINLDVTSINPFSKNSKTFYIILLGALCQFPATMLLLYSLRNYNINIVFSVFNIFSIIFGALLAHFLFNEKISPKQYVGLVTMIMGIILFYFYK